MKAAVARAAYPGAELIGPVRLASRMGSGWRLQTHEGSPSAAASLPESVEDRPLMAGIHGLRELRPGLHLHVTDIVHLCDLHTVCRLEDIGFKILLRLEGSARVVIDGVELPLVAGSGAAARPVGLLLGLAAPVQFERRSQRGVQERMVVLTLGMDWLRQAGLDAAQCSRHLSLHAWRPSMRAIAIAEQLIRPPLVDDPLAFLATEAGALALIHEAMQALPLTGEALPVSVQPQTTAYLRVVRLRAQIEAGECDGLCLNEIARRAGCNATTLQREFHGVVGKSIDRYRRECSLLRAAAALRQQGVSVGHAAEIAGYGSQANFSTAFRRHFGICPKQYRRAG